MADTKRKEQKGMIGYGVKPPIISFQEALTILRDLYRKVGSSGSEDDLSKIVGNTTTSSSFTLKVRTLKNFGLLLTTDSKYQTTELAERIMNPTSANEKPEAELEALLSLEILRAIFDNFKGKVLPEREFLANYIQSNLKIPTELKEKWADYFVQAASVVGILHKRNDGSTQVLSSPSRSIEPEEARPQPQKSTEQPSTIPAEKQREGSGIIADKIEANDWGILNQRTVSNGRKAIFAIPDRLSKSDVKALKVIIKGIEATIDGLCDEGDHTESL